MSTINKGAYPPATLVMNSMGHLHAWPGTVDPDHEGQNVTLDGQDSPLYVQLDADVEQILSSLPEDEADDLRRGWTVHTTNFPDDYFSIGLAAGGDMQKAEGTKPKPRRYTLAEISAMPTISSGHTDNLKYDDGDWRVWLSRLGVEDGMPYDNAVTVERRNGGTWVQAEVYKPRAKAAQATTQKGGGGGSYAASTLVLDEKGDVHAWRGTLTPTLAKGAAPVADGREADVYLIDWNGQDAVKLLPPNEQELLVKGFVLHTINFPDGFFSDLRKSGLARLQKLGKASFGKALSAQLTERAEAQVESDPALSAALTALVKAVAANEDGEAADVATAIIKVLGEKPDQVLVGAVAQVTAILKAMTDDPAAQATAEHIDAVVTALNKRSQSRVRKTRKAPGVLSDMAADFSNVPTLVNEDGETIWETIDPDLASPQGNVYAVWFGTVGNVGLAQFYIVDAPNESEALNDAAWFARDMDDGVMTRDEAIENYGADENGEPVDAISVDQGLYVDPETGIRKLPAKPPAAQKAQKARVRKLDMEAADDEGDEFEDDGSDPNATESPNPNHPGFDVAEWASNVIGDGAEDEQFGDAQSVGYYALLIEDLGDEGKGFIYHEDSQGFRDVDTYDTEAAARAAWQSLQDDIDAEIAGYLDDGDTRNSMERELSKNPGADVERLVQAAKDHMESFWGGDKSDKELARIAAEVIAEAGGGKAAKARFGKTVKRPGRGVRKARLNSVRTIGIKSKDELLQFQREFEKPFGQVEGKQAIKVLENGGKIVIEVYDQVARLGQTPDGDMIPASVSFVEKLGGNAGDGTLYFTRRALANAGLGDKIESAADARKRIGAKAARARFGKRRGVRKASAYTVVDGYLDAVLFAETDESDENTGGEPLSRNYDIGDFTPEARAKVVADIEKFMQQAGALLDQVGEYSEYTLGSNIYFTRNGHGAGFWDTPEDWGGDETAEQLTEIAKRLGEDNWYVTDDGQIDKAARGRMRKAGTARLYTFNELPNDKAKQKAREWFIEGWGNDTSYKVSDDLRQWLKEQYPWLSNTDVEWSVGGGQSDYANFDAQLDVDVFARAKGITLPDDEDGERATSVMIRDGVPDYNSDDGLTDEFKNALDDELAAIVGRGRRGLLYREAESIVEYEMSDDVVDDMLVTNEYTFLADGRRADPDDIEASAKARFGKRRTMRKASDRAVQGYLEAVLFAETDNSDENTGGEPLDRNYDVSDITPAAKAKVAADIDEFVQQAKALLDQVGDYDDHDLGSDLYFTRNNHGVGFWDDPEKWGGDEVADQLTEIAHRMGEDNWYVTDDGQIDKAARGRMRKAKFGQCECSDPGCPVHRNKGCSNKASVVLYRSDMDDESGVAFCEACADDAMESGVFTSEPPGGDGEDFEFSAQSKTRKAARARFGKRRGVRKGRRAARPTLRKLSLTQIVGASKAFENLDEATRKCLDQVLAAEPLENCEKKGLEGVLEFLTGLPEQSDDAAEIAGRISAFLNGEEPEPAEAEEDEAEEYGEGAEDEEVALPEMAAGETEEGADGGPEDDSDDMADEPPAKAAQPRFGKAGAYQVGDTVQYRLFNSAEGKSYGPVLTAKIVRIGEEHPGGTSPYGSEVMYVVDKPGYGELALHRREIIRRVKAAQARFGKTAPRAGRLAQRRGVRKADSRQAIRDSFTWKNVKDGLDGTTPLMPGHTFEIRREDYQGYKFVLRVAGSDDPRTVRDKRDKREHLKEGAAFFVEWNTRKAARTRFGKTAPRAGRLASRRRVRKGDVMDIPLTGVERSDSWAVMRELIEQGEKDPSVLAEAAWEEILDRKGDPYMPEALFTIADEALAEYEAEMTPPEGWEWDDTNKWFSRSFEVGQNYYGGTITRTRGGWEGKLDDRKIGLYDDSGEAADAVQSYVNNELVESLDDQGVDTSGVKWNDVEQWISDQIDAMTEASDDVDAAAYDLAVAAQEALGFGGNSVAEAEAYAKEELLRNFDYEAAATARMTKHRNSAGASPASTATNPLASVVEGLRAQVDQLTAAYAKMRHTPRPGGPVTREIAGLAAVGKTLATDMLTPPALSAPRGGDERLEKRAEELRRLAATEPNMALRKQYRDELSDIEHRLTDGK